MRLLSGGNAGGRAVLAIDFAQGLTPFAGGDPGVGAGDGGLHQVALFVGGILQAGQGLFGAGVVAPGTPNIKGFDLVRLGVFVDTEEVVARGG